MSQGRRPADHRSFMSPVAWDAQRFDPGASRLLATRAKLKTFIGGNARQDLACGVHGYAAG